MSENSYNCTQEQLYSVASHCWNHCLEHQIRFHSLKAKYTEEFIDDNIQAITAAQNLPDAMQRALYHKLKHIQLKNSAISCRQLFNTLKRYIADAYPKNEQQDYNEAAGQSHYKLASANNWGAVKSLITAAKKFATDHSDELCNNDNMPVGFPAILEDQRTAFTNLHQAFAISLEESASGTDLKLDANNDLYDSLMKMNYDGQAIFVNEPNTAKEFIFEQVLALYTGEGSAGARGTVINSAINNPVAGAIISFGSPEHSAESDPDGKYVVSPVPAGIYTITVTAEGFETLIITGHEVKLGTISTLNILLVPLP